MNEVTKHRGPDETGFWLSENISLGHNRLSIIDLSSKASQPMSDEKGELVIVFNGEIYNFIELRKELKKKYNFKSQSDTEVILYAYKEYGAECVKRFNGIFSFAVWDVVKKELFLARDRMGIKPLYYYYDGQRLIFSSEIKGILTHDIPRRVDRDAFSLFFSVLYVPEPYTMFAEIKKLPTASFLIFKHGSSPVIKKYWSITDFANLNSYSAATDAIRDIFRDSVRRQLVSDRPVGVFLSGGIDSTAVLGAVSEFHNGKVKTFSVGFKDSHDTKKFNADFFLARKTAEYYSTGHHELLIGPEDIRNNLENIAWHLDEPNFNPTAVAQFLLSKMAKQDVAVVLGGDGGDELFGGYPRYYYSALVSKVQAFVPKIIRGIISPKFNLPTNEQRITAFLSQKPGLLAEVINARVLNQSEAGEYLKQKYFDQHNFSPYPRDFVKDFEKVFMSIDRQSWLVDESLLRTDKMTMAFGLEERVPILDYRLVELANKIPTAWKFRIWNQRPSNFQGKLIWREAIQDFLPAHILNEKKRGWFTPMAKWIRKELKDTVADVLSPRNLNGEYFDATGVRKVWEGHLSGEHYNLNIIWAVVMWQLWFNRFIKK